MTNPLPTLSLDETGSLVPAKPKQWIIGFVPPIEAAFWHRFAHGNHKHCFAMRPIDDGKLWLLFEPWWSRLMVTVIDYNQARKFLAWTIRGDALVVREHIPGRSSQFRGWASCAALVAHLLGRKYQVWSPHSLYKRLRKEPGTAILDSRAYIDSLDRRLRRQPEHSARAA